MTRLVTKDDFLDSWVKIKERGFQFVLSKFNVKKMNRTKSAFNNESAVTVSNWWIIPAIRKRWNLKISGNPDVDYPEYYVNRYVRAEDSLKLLSLGSGSCTNESKFASYPAFQEVVCIDISDNRLKEAQAIATKKGIKTMRFICEDILTYDFPENQFDVVLFNASLHHFNHVRNFLELKIKKTLKSGGRIIINEYVGADRLQYPRNQIKAINQALKLIDKPFRVKHKTNLIKNSYSGPGIFRMILSDPSEAIDSSSILPALRQNFDIIDERPP